MFWNLGDLQICQISNLEGAKDEELEEARVCTCRRELFKSYLAFISLMNKNENI